MISVQEVETVHRILIDTFGGSHGIAIGSLWNLVYKDLFKPLMEKSFILIRWRKEQHLLKVY